MPVQAPGPGEWTVSVWRRDAAGNADPAAASVPVTLRFDPEPPQLAFESPSAGDPTLVAAQVTDKVSGLAEGAIEISQAGSNVWQTLATQKDGSRLVARIDDAALPAGDYVLRATARDQARNEASTTSRLDGQPMAVRLPLRIPSAMRVGVVRHRVVHRVVRRHGKRHRVRRRVTVLRRTGQVRLGGRVTISGRLTNRDGQGVAGAEVQVLAASPIAPEQLVGVVHTGADGSYSYTAAGSTSRSLRFVYAGSALTLPAEGKVGLIVPAATSLRVSRHRVLNGQRVRFGGQVRSLPVPAGGQARAARGAAVGTLADVPHRAHRRVRALGDPVPVRPHARGAAVPIPGVAAGGGRLSVRRRRVEELDSAGEGALMYRWRRHDTGEGTVLNSIRRRLTYANVMSTLAVFIALGGSSYAAVKINGSSIKDRSIAGKKLRHNTLTGRQIRESRLGTRAVRAQRRPPRRHHGRRAEDQCPSDTFPTADVCVEKTPRAPAVVRKRGADVPRRSETPEGPGRRLPTHGELRAALGAVAARAGRRADVERLPVELGPGPARRALRHRPGRQRRR